MKLSLVQRKLLFAPAIDMINCVCTFEQYDEFRRAQNEQQQKRLQKKKERLEQKLSKLPSGEREEIQLNINQINQRLNVLETSLNQLMGEEQDWKDNPNRKHPVRIVDFMGAERLTTQFAQYNDTVNDIVNRCTNLVNEVKGKLSNYEKPYQHTDADATLAVELKTTTREEFDALIVGLTEAFNNRSRLTGNVRDEKPMEIRANVDKMFAANSGISEHSHKLISTLGQLNDLLTKLYSIPTDPSEIPLPTSAPSSNPSSRRSSVHSLSAQENTTNPTASTS